MQVRYYTPMLGAAAALVLLLAGRAGLWHSLVPRRCGMSPAHRSTRSIRMSRGTTREAFAVSLSTYDRLVSFGRKQLTGKWVFDLDKITGELAESYDVSPDGLKITFHCAQGWPSFRTGQRSPPKTSNGRSTVCVTAPVLGKAPAPDGIADQRRSV